MDDKYEWVKESKKSFILMRNFDVPANMPRTLAKRLRHRVASVFMARNHKNEQTWFANSAPTTYHGKKRKAMEGAEIKYMEQLVMRTAKIPDLTNAYWSTEMIGEHRFDVLRVNVNGEMHQVASIDERGNPQFWAAIRGRGQVPLDGANTFEEARAVCVALIRMGG